MLLLFFIFIRDITFAATIDVSKLITKHHDWYLLLFYLLQIIAAPLQASFSDNYCRRKTLALAFLSIFIGHIFLFIGFVEKSHLNLLICLIINGILGNVIPIAIAGMLDINYLNSTRKIMGYMMATLAVAWLIYVYGVKFFGLLSIFWVSTILCFVASCLAIFVFKDRRDLSLRQMSYHIGKEIGEVAKYLNKKWFHHLLTSYIISEIVYYTLFYYYIVVKLDTTSLLFVVSTFAGGYLIGSFISINEKLSVSKGFYLGMTTSILSMLVLLLSCLFPQFSLNFKWTIIINTIFSLGYGIFDPCIYSFFSTKQPLHKQGKIFGIVDSGDNLSELSSTGLLLFSAVAKQEYFYLAFLPLLLIALILLKKSFSEKSKV